MSTRGDCPVRQRVQSVRLAEPLDDVPVDFFAMMNPPITVDSFAPVDPFASIDHPAPRGPTNLPYVPDSGVATLAGGVPTSSSVSTSRVVDETLSRQFLHLIQNAVRSVGHVFETPISRLLISNGVRTFSGSFSGAPNEAEDWLHDTERRMDELCLEPYMKYLGVVSVLYGNAYTWWESIVSSIPADCLTWEFFKERFWSRFIGERYMREIRQRFQNLVQGDTSVLEYEIEFLSLLRYGSCLVPTEKDKCRKFALGLQYELFGRDDTEACEDNARLGLT
ncbi:hypothetical protein GQ457_15G027750 [Hibiscus cannabinus]